MSSAAIVGVADAFPGAPTAGLAALAAYAPERHAVVVGGLAEFPDAAARFLLLHPPVRAEEDPAADRWILTALDGADQEGADNSVIVAAQTTGFAPGAKRARLSAPGRLRGTPSGSVTADTRAPIAPPA